MKNNKFISKLPQNLQIIPTKAAQCIKGGSADSNTGAASPIVVDIVGGS